MFSSLCGFPWNITYLDNMTVRKLFIALLGNITVIYLVLHIGVAHYEHIVPLKRRGPPSYIM